MAGIKNDHIEFCKKLLEEKFSFGNGHGYTQKDLEQLSLYIEENTGYYISLSTLKRVWKGNYKTQPQVATLNALVEVLGYKNWQDFKIQHQKAKIEEEKGPQKNRLPLYLAASVAVIIMVVAVFSFGKSGASTVKIDGPVSFSADKTVAKGVPNTFIFEYDLSHVEADSFFIQQSWNGWRKEKIDPKKKVYASTYYESGYHRARLIANTDVVATQAVHIISDGWEPHVYYSEADDRFIDFKGETFIAEGRLHLPMELLKKRKLDTSRYFMSRISHSDDYGVSSNNFGFKTKIKLDRVMESNCPWVNVIIITTEHIFSVALARTGCETGASYKLGEIYKSGKDNNLSKLGTDLYDWNDLEIQVRDKKATIFLNGQEAYTEHYLEDLGDIMGLAYVFEGTGSIDFVQLTNESNEAVFQDDF
ncbi:hypothetical protein [Allomuricauda sp. CP2A]|jgi:uncharacterized protein YozE (UPF0346 family)|uniref:hypothetical protein n=1 Tax=Allomuricauda sp. CP2A TaxID=1848189 RepID=UPI000837589F|nr:hypothetical protein [Muricauda sp. CP2A]